MGRFEYSSIYGSAQVLWLRPSSILQRDEQFTFLALLSQDHVKDRAYGIDTLSNYDTRLDHQETMLQVTLWHTPVQITC